MTTTVEDAVKLASERIDAWIAALRDPNRKQAHGVLKSRNGGQCCLGVLCDIAGLKSVRYASGDYHYIGPVRGDEYYAKPPQCVANSVGIGTRGNLEGGWDSVADWGRLAPDYHNLMSLNDDLGFNFPQIADVIETNKAKMIEQVRLHAERKLEV